MVAPVGVAGNGAAAAVYIGGGRWLGGGGDLGEESRSDSHPAAAASSRTPGGRWRRGHGPAWLGWASAQSGAGSLFFFLFFNNSAETKKILEK